MTEQQACTLCGAGGHTAAQCNWNKSQDLHPDMKRVYDVIGLHYSHPVSVLIANFENTKRFAELLHAVEREFFMVPGEPSDEPEDQGCEPDDVCLVRCWGSTQEQYIEQFRDALSALQARAALAQPSPAPELEQSQGAEVFLTLTGEITQLKAKLAEMEKQAPLAWVDADWIAQVSDPRGAGCTVRRAYGSAGADLAPLYRKPVAQAGQVPEEWRDMIASLQWHYRDHDDHWHRSQGYYCSQCGGEQSAGHKEGCELSALLAAAPAQGGGA